MERKVYATLIKVVQLVHGMGCYRALPINDVYKKHKTLVGLFSKISLDILLD